MTDKPYDWLAVKRERHGLTTTSPPPTSAAPIAQRPSPGWYPGPAGTPNTRWWDGTTWTDHIQPNREQ